MKAQQVADGKWLARGMQIKQAGWPDNEEGRLDSSLLYCNEGRDKGRIDSCGEGNGKGTSDGSLFG